MAQRNEAQQERREARERRKKERKKKKKKQKEEDLSFYLWDRVSSPFLDKRGMKKGKEGERRDKGKKSNGQGSTNAFQTII